MTDNKVWMVDFMEMGY